MSVLVSLRAAFARTAMPRLALLRSRGHAVAPDGQPHRAATMSAPREESSAVARLVAVTDGARRALGDRHEVRIATFPFKVGRECRSPNSAFMPLLIDFRLGTAPPVNDVYLLEAARTDLWQISREHFLIERVAPQFVVVDRASVRGTIVGGRSIGGHGTGGRTELRDGELITVGATNSEYVFRFEVLSPRWGTRGI